MTQEHEGAAAEQPPLIWEFQDKRFEECFSTEADRMALLRDLSMSDFHRAVKWFNGNIRNITREERGYLSPDEVDGVMDETGHIQYVSPAGEDRLALMEYGFTAAQHAEDAMTAGAILALTIVNTRPLPAANDTTARMAFSLMSRGYSGTPEDIAHYSSIARGDTSQSVWDICNRAGLPQRFAAVSTYDIAAHYGMTNYVPVGVVNHFPREMGIRELERGDPRRDAAAMADEPALSRAVLTEFVLRAGRDLRDYLVRGPEESLIDGALQAASWATREYAGEGKYRQPSQDHWYIDASAVIADIQPHDVGLLWKVYRVIKADYVKSIIDCFAGNDSIHGDWRIILAYFHRLKDDIPGAESMLPPEQVPSTPDYDPCIQAIRFVMETMGVTDPNQQED